MFKVTGKALHYFAGGNTARGFFSLYDSNFAGLEKVFILKGGPGTGKSTLMKKIAMIGRKKTLMWSIFTVHPILIPWMASYFQH